MAQVEVWVPGLAKHSGPRVVWALVALGAAAALVVRRRRPLASELVVCAVVLWPVLLGWFIQSTALVLMLVVAVFACGRYGARPSAYLAIPLASALVLSAAGPDPDQTIAGSWAWSLNTVWVFALGAGFRHERLLRDRASAASESRSQAEAAQERLGVARELHDVLSHSLAVVVIQAELADTLLDVDLARSRDAVRQIAAVARTALADTRGIVELLRDPGAEPSSSPSLGLEDVPALVGRVRESGLPVTLTIGSPVPTLSAEVAATAYRVVQESLTNVLRHAGQVPTQVSVETAQGTVIIDVHDDGQTQERDEDETFLVEQSGHGLIGMRERVSSCGGDLTSGPSGDGGFRVRAVLPARSAQ
jgi:signal transduction histidine kinase